MGIGVGERPTHAQEKTVGKAQPVFQILTYLIVTRKVRWKELQRHDYDHSISKQKTRGQIR